MYKRDGGEQIQDPLEQAYNDNPYREKNDLSGSINSRFFDGNSTDRDEDDDWNEEENQDSEIDDNNEDEALKMTWDYEMDMSEANNLMKRGYAPLKDDFYNIDDTCATLLSHSDSASNERPESEIHPESPFDIDISDEDETLSHTPEDDEDMNDSPTGLNQNENGFYRFFEKVESIIDDASDKREGYQTALKLISGKLSDLKRQYMDERTDLLADRIHQLRDLKDEYEDKLDELDVIDSKSGINPKNESLYESKHSQYGVITSEDGEDMISRNTLTKLFKYWSSILISKRRPIIIDRGTNPRHIEGIVYKKLTDNSYEIFVKHEVEPVVVKLNDIIQIGYDDRNLPNDMKNQQEDKYAYSSREEDDAPTDTLGDRYSDVFDRMGDDSDDRD